MSGVALRRSPITTVASTAIANREIKYGAEHPAVPQTRTLRKQKNPVNQGLTGLIGGDVVVGDASFELATPAV